MCIVINEYSYTYSIILIVVLLRINILLNPIITSSYVCKCTISLKLWHEILLDKINSMAY